MTNKEDDDYGLFRLQGLEPKKARALVYFKARVLEQRIFNFQRIFIYFLFNLHFFLFVYLQCANSGSFFITIYNKFM